jgi:hypothetical protein
MNLRMNFRNETARELDHGTAPLVDIGGSCPSVAMTWSSHGAAGIKRIRVISEGTPKRFGGPQ